MNKWMEFSNEYTQLMKDNFQVMNKFWRAAVHKPLATVEHFQ